MFEEVKRDLEKMSKEELIEICIVQTIQMELLKSILGGNYDKRRNTANLKSIKSKLS